MEEWLSDTRRVVIVGGKGLGVNIKKDIVDALELKQGSLVEIRIRNTGKFAEPDARKKVEPPKDEDYTSPEDL